MNKYLNHFGLILIAIFGVSYLVFYPQTWLISDVNAYVNQALAFAEGRLFLEWKDVTGTIDLPVHGTWYPLGNAFWLALFIYLFGPQGAFLSGLIAVTLSAFLINRVIIQEGYPRWTIAIFFLYASLLFFSRTLMSAMPSLLIISFMVYFLFRLKEGPRKYFVLALLAGISVWFRESNLMISGPICIWIFLRNRNAFIYLIFGFIAGLSFRLASSWWVYDDPFFYILAEPFSTDAILNNAFVYLVLMTIMIPGAWLFNGYKGRYKLEIISTIWIFLCFYLLYDFNATGYSGFAKGLILTGRFLIPVTPLIVIAMAGTIKHLGARFSGKVFTTIMLLITAVVIVSSQFLGYQEHKKHKNVIDAIEEYKEGILIYDTKNYTNINRYVNAFNGLPDRAADIRLLGDKNYMASVLERNRNVFILESGNVGGIEKNKRTNELSVYIEDARKNFNVRLVRSIPVSQGLEIRVYKLSE